MNTKVAEQNGIEKLMADLEQTSADMKAKGEEMDGLYRQLNAGFNGLKDDNGEIKKSVEALTKQYADAATEFQALQAGVNQLKKEMEAPVYRSEKDLSEVDRKNAVELQKRVFLSKGGDEDNFQPDLENLVNLSAYRSACQKLVKYGGLQKRSEIYRERFSDIERKSFDAASLDTAFFSPEMLGLTVDCNIECASLLDLYSRVSVSKSKFQYMRIKDYGDIGSYHCDVDCDAPLGRPGNISYENGKTYDFRGLFCFLKKVLDEANFDFLAFMMLAAQRSYRINRNEKLINGSGDNEPEGWLTADCFRKNNTAPTTFNHVDFRRFMSLAPVEYGRILPVMHQNVFGYLVSGVDNTGRFLFGDGILTFNPDDVRESLRISNCLPDPTDGGTKGSAENPFDANSFILAAANWENAVAVVDKSPLVFEQFIGGSTKWCAKYQFGAEDGSFIKCCEAGQTLWTGA